MAHAQSPASPRRVTIAEVAQAAGVSTTTVSHVLTGRRPVSASTRSRVQAVVERLDYRPSQVARHLRVGRSKMIAVLVPDITNPFYSQLLRGLSDALGEEYGSYVCSTDGSAHRQRRFLADAAARGADGIVLSSLVSAPRTSDAGPTPGIPVVYVGGSRPRAEDDEVIVADLDGSFAAVRHLVTGGSSRVAMIGGRPAAAASRLAGYRRALEEFSHPAQRPHVVYGDFTRSGGRAAMLELLGSSRPPDAVFCANDLMAIGALDAARARGLSVPGDLRLVGFDDIEAASMVTPALSTVSNPAYESGWAAGGLLMDRLRADAEPGEGRSTVLPCRLVLRESS